MSKLRDLIEQGPALCGAKNAARWSKSFLLQFDDELQDPSSVFAARERETVAERLETLWALKQARGIDELKVEYWGNLITLAALSYGVSKGIEAMREQQEVFKRILIDQEPQYPDISALMTVQEASTLGNWA